MARQLCILSGPVVSKKVRHLLVTNGTEQEMDVPLFLVMEADSETKGVFLYRFDKSGNCVGDTWHAVLEDAHRQAVFEYEGLLGSWKDIPADGDMAAFGLSEINKRQ